MNIEDIPYIKQDRPPYRVGERKVRKAPGSRTYTETWYDPESGMHQFHEGCDYIYYAEFWEEVEMLTNAGAAVDVLQQEMRHLTEEQCQEGYAHYYDLWTWEDASERNRRLMDAFEAEWKTPKHRLIKVYDFGKRGIPDTEALLKCEEEVKKALAVPDFILKGIAA